MTQTEFALNFFFDLKSNNFKAVIFDMDGVIVDSEALSIASEKKALLDVNVVPHESDWETFRGKTSIAIFDYIIKKFEIPNVTPQELRKKKMEYYMGMFNENIKIFDGFNDLINYLQPKYITALTTSSGKDIKDKIFETFGLEKFFTHIVTGDMVTNSKPHPEPYLMTLEKLSLPANKCIVIEDSDNGIISAKTAGITTIAVTHTFSREKLLGADYIVDSLSEIKNII